MTFDWDDLGLSPNADARFLKRILELKAIRRDFKCTLFAVPGTNPAARYFAPDSWLVEGEEPTDDVWIELAVHGYMHPTPVECADWTYERAVQAIEQKPHGFVDMWKSPGWQISDGTYRAMLEADWAVADQHLEDDRRPVGLRTYLYEDGGNWHGHVQNVCGNGLEETWDTVVALVEDAESFEFASEKAVPWRSVSVS